MRRRGGLARRDRRWCWPAAPATPRPPIPHRPSPAADAARRRPTTPAYDAALSEPVEDRVYPDVGDPGVDALHYDLDLTWDPETSVLTGAETLTFRSTEDDDEFQLDLEPSLEVSEVTLDGEAVDFEQQDKDLVVTADVAADERYVVEIDYSGSPSPVAAPTTRPDIPALGWTTMPDGVDLDDAGAVRRLHLVRRQRPARPTRRSTTSRCGCRSRWVGVANGELVSRETVDGQDGHRVAPRRAGGVVPHHGRVRGLRHRRGDLRRAAFRSPIWLPGRRGGAGWTGCAGPPSTPSTGPRSVLGPYPFDSLGFLFVDSTSGMETQTMITLGLTELRARRSRCWSTRSSTSGGATRSRRATGATSG